MNIKEILENIKEILEYELLNINGYIITMVTIIGIIIILVLSKIVLKTTLRFIRQSAFVKNKLDHGRRFALEQFLRYLIYIITFLILAQSVGINLSLIWAGSAALLVGIGLGLQQIFNDLASGVILLVEGEIAVGDVVIVDGTLGKIQKISIRASHIETKEKVIMIVPNSKLITSNVSNLGSPIKNTARFTVKVGVAYGSDVQLVKKLLLQVAAENVNVEKTPNPIVFFANFGDSSLDFELHFFCHELLYIDRIKSELRFEIDAIFRTHNIQIPFPQRDIWFRNTPQ